MPGCKTTEAVRSSARSSQISFTCLTSQTSQGGSGRPLAARLGVAVLTMAALCAQPILDACASSQTCTSLSRDDLRELACAPDSNLSQAYLEKGGSATRITLETGYDLGKRHTIDRLKEEVRSRRPRKLWISLPCTPWTGQNNFLAKSMRNH